MSFSTNEQCHEDEFNISVESIMKCGDFKSNFARRLSNRYIAKAPVQLHSKYDDSRKKRSLDVLSSPEEVRK